jgi:hypothetical protein
MGYSQHIGSFLTGCVAQNKILKSLKPNTAKDFRLAKKIGKKLWHIRWLYTRQMKMMNTEITIKEFETEVMPASHLSIVQFKTT